MSVLGPEAAAFVQSQSERTIPLLGKYVTKVPARVISVSGTAPNQKAVVATPDQIAALATGEITEIPRPAMPVYGTVIVDQWVWCLADAAGLHIMGTPGGGTGGTQGPAGADGKSVLNGSGAPLSTLGNNGDFYVDTQNSRFYGPKAGGAWPTGYISLAGQTGQAGRGFTPRGTWAAATAYAVDDLVNHLGSTYRRKVAGTSATVPVSDTTNWELWAQKGDTGAASTVPGPAGPGVPTGGSTGQVLRKTSGTDYATEWVGPEYCELSLSASVAILNDTFTPVNWTSETNDPLNWHSTSSNLDRITPGVAGLYLVTLSTLWANNTSGMRQQTIWLNGSTLRANDNTSVVSPFVNTGPQTSSALIYLGATDYIQIQIRQTSGGSLNLNANSSMVVARIK